MLLIVKTKLNCIELTKDQSDNNYFNNKINRIKLFYFNNKPNPIESINQHILWFKL